MLANNGQINWLPEHIQDGRFGNFLETNVDWALSRERYWGTPLPIWVCEETGQMEAVASYDELLAKPGVAGTEVWEEAKAGQSRSARRSARSTSPTSTRSPTTRPRPPGARMRRVTEVIDCWFDSGRDAVRPVGLSAPGGLGRAVRRAVSRPTSSARRSTRPAAGSTACWRSARCLFGDGRRGRPPDAARRRRSTIRIRSATASCWG